MVSWWALLYLHLLTMNKLFYIFIIFFLLFMSWQLGRWYGYGEGHNQTLEAIGRSTVKLP